MTALAGIFGFLLLAAVASDAFEVMLLPRRVRRQLRPVRFFFQTTWFIWSNIGRRLRRPSMRDGFFSAFGPLSMVLLLCFWTFGLVVSFALINWAIVGNPDWHQLATDLYLSGATFFTLGYGDVVPKIPAAKALSVFEAGAGLGFIAVTISYLPVLYQLFSRRESRVIQLDARAGSPPTSLTLLSRHHEFDALPELMVLLKDWEQWCADMVESHLSYPMLSYYRSQQDNQSWLAALTSILDTCALMLTGLSGVPTFQARITFGMARAAVVELCRVFHLKLSRRPTERLNDEQWHKLEEGLADGGLTFSDPDEARERLSALRSTYEPFAQSLSRHLLLQLPPWIPEDEAKDNWQRSRGGDMARELVENTPPKPE